MKSGIKVQLDKARLDDLAKNFPDRVDAVSEKVAGDIVAYIHAHFSRTAPHPSRPGDPPAVLTGELKKCVKVRRVKHRYYHVVVNAEYARYLEYGTAIMAARPFMRPAVMAIAGKVPAALKAALNDTRGVGGGRLRTIVRG
jgi:HK97 gp10 family phage protein